MKAKLLVLTLAAVLASCASGNSGGTKVDQAKFMEECKKIEDHVYARCTVKFKGTLKEGDVETKMDYEFKYVWNGTTKAFDYDGDAPTDPNEYYAAMQTKSQISYTLKKIAQMQEEDPEPLPEGYKYEYYINPFRVVSEITGEYQTTKNDSKYNKYGYIVSLKANISAMGGTQTSKSTATATYADA